MILSHKLQCIFIKTGKTAGTSLEISLSKFLGKNDIVTPNSKSEESIRQMYNFVTCQNYLKSLHEIRWRDIYNSIKRIEKSLRHKELKKGIWPMKFYNHISAKEIKKYVSEDIWNSYLKFTIERNPWDKVVSHYFWYIKDDGRKEKMSFNDFVMQGYSYKSSNYDLYSINGVPQIDFFLRYENLHDDLSSLSNYIGIKENLYDVMKSIKAKDEYRDKMNYREMYDEMTRNAVRCQFGREIHLFNYQF